MGQKIHPTGFRLAVNRNWGSKWFANSKNYSGILAQDIKVREYLGKKLSHASVAKITIERPAKNARITIHSARPGVVIGKKGEDIETRAVDRDPRVLRRPLDRHFGDRRVRELLLQVLAHLQVLRERRAVMLLVGEPLRAPVAVDREAEAGRMNLLSHGGS